jgi:hypothetical protein
MDRFAIAVVLAVVLGSGSSCRKKARERFPPPQSLVPRRCNETGEPRIEIANLRRRETGKPPPLWEYLLDLRVHIGNSEKRWLLVDQTYFPEHVHEVSRDEEDLPDWLTSWSLDSSQRPRADPQIEWTFTGDGEHVHARWLPRGGELMVNNIQAFRTKDDERRLPVILMDVIVDHMDAIDWVAAGKTGNRRSVREEDAVSTFTTVQCVDWLELGAPD